MGLVIIGVTDEPPSLVDKWVAKYEPEYPLVSLKTDDLERFLDVGFFPTAAVIDPDGTLAFSGSTRDLRDPLETALKTAKKGPIFPKAFLKVNALIAGGSYDKSYAELLKLIDKGKLSDDERQVADMLKSYLESLAARAHESAKELFAQGFAYEAVQVVRPYAVADPGFPASQECAAFLKQVEEMSDYKGEMKGGELYLEAKEKEEEYDFSDAVKTYRTVFKKFGGTRIAENAMKRARELVDRGSPGFQMACNPCRKSGKARMRACDKHRERVKL